MQGLCLGNTRVGWGYTWGGPGSTIKACDIDELAKLELVGVRGKDRVEGVWEPEELAKKLDATQTLINNVKLEGKFGLS